MTPAPDVTSRARRSAVALFAALFVIYNANGRELGTVDSQPAKFTAREVAVRHTLVLDRVIAERPALAERPAFGRDRQGHFRSAYPLAPALLASIPATLLHAVGLVDLDAPLAPNLIAVLTASVLTSWAVALVWLALSRIVSPRLALVTAVGLGVGTNFWPVVSRTLWQHETVAFGLALALWAWLKPASDLRSRDVVWGGLGLALAGAARPQVSILVATLLAWLIVRTSVRRAAPAFAIVACAAAIVCATNLYWFGHVLGGAVQLEAVHPGTHGVPGPISATPWIGMLGLLISPSRGLLIFSPIVIVALAGLRAAGRERHDLALGWLAAGLALQFAAYAFYAVWWGGHTYGPRYLIDLLVPLSVFGALGARRWAQSRSLTIAGALLLAWSIVVAAAGAIVYPNERWNTDPESVDLNHARLWEVRDSQIPRTLTTAPSPQNLSLWDRGTVRRQ